MENDRWFQPPAAVPYQLNAAARHVGRGTVGIQLAAWKSASATV